MTKKQVIRQQFRRAVMVRDGYRCRHCGRAGYDRQTGDSAAGRIHTGGSLVPLDAHHIRDRSECEDGGYTLDNGLTLCSECHKKEEGL